MIVEVMFWILLAALAVWILRKIARARRRRRRHHDWTGPRPAREAAPLDKSAFAPAKERREPRLTRWPDEIRRSAGGERI